MKSAKELLDEFVVRVRPPRGAPIAITERPSFFPDDPNWIAGMGVVGAITEVRFSECNASFRRSDPFIDWSEVPAERGGCRRVGLHLRGFDAEDA